MVMDLVELRRSVVDFRWTLVLWLEWRRWRGGEGGWRIFLLVDGPAYWLLATK
jgi:hypothetical protein